MLGMYLVELLVVAIETQGCFSPEHALLLSLPSGPHHFLLLGRVHLILTQKHIIKKVDLQRLHLDFFGVYAITCITLFPECGQLRLSGFDRLTKVETEAESSPRTHPPGEWWSLD